MNYWTGRHDTTIWMLLYILLEDTEVPKGKYMAFSDQTMDRNPPIPKFVIIRTMAPPKAATGRQSGAKGYSRDEVRYLLDILERRLPVGPDEWELCVQDHAVGFEGRDLNSIRRKYASLHRKNIPTGDPRMPPEVRQAKRIKHLIGRRVDIGDGEEVYELQQNAFLATDRNREAADGESLGNEDVSDENPQPFVPLTQPSQGSQEEEDEDLEPPPAPRKAPPPSQTPQPSQTPPPAAPPAAMSSVSSSFSSARNTVRPYNRKNAHQEDFVELFKLQLQQQQQAREEEARQRKEDRELFMQGVTAFMGAVGNYLSSNSRSSKRKRSDSDSE